MEQEIAKGLGMFMRLGWNDGKTESFEFTAVDRLATGGVSQSGARWKRPEDTVATELTVSGLSAVHALYLERGGLDFIIGDGRLNYGRNTSGKLITTPVPGRSLRDSRRAVHHQSRLQSGSRTALGVVAAPAPGMQEERNEARAGESPPTRRMPRPAFSSWNILRYRFLALFAVIGPGFITANVDNDPGGILTYSQAGAKYGYTLLWTLIPTTSR